MWGIALLLMSSRASAGLSGVARSGAAGPGRHLFGARSLMIKNQILKGIWKFWIFVITFKYIFKSFESSNSVFLTVGGIAHPDGQGGEKTKEAIGGKKHQGGENAQLLVDDWVNFSILLLWHERSLQILIYYDNRWRLLLKQFLLNFTLDRLLSRLQFGLFQSCGAVVKMSQLLLRSSSFHEHGSRLQLRRSWFSWVWLRFRSSLFSWLRLQLRLLFVFTH